MELFKKAHRSFITTWLSERGIIDKEDSSDLKTMLKKVSKACSQAVGTDRKYLLLILYVLYFSLGTYSWKYRFSYLADRNIPALRLRFIYTFRLFTSRKTRRDRTGFN